MNRYFQELGMILHFLMANTTLVPTLCRCSLIEFHSIINVVLKHILSLLESNYDVQDQQHSQN